MQQETNKIDRIVPWHTLAVAEVFSRLESNESGLSSTEAALRLERFGANELREERAPSWVKIFLRQFQGPIIWILIGAAIIAALLGDWLDSSAVMAIMLLNAILGSLQEHSAEKAIVALRALATPTARVLRDGAVVQLPARVLVPGDVIQLEAGDLVPADACVLNAASVRVVESALTGESEPVSKVSAVVPSEKAPLAERTNMLFMGTLVATGMARAVVTSTGMTTEVGSIASLLQTEPQQTKTPLQEKMESFGRVLIRTALGIVILLFLVGIIRGLPINELFLTVVSLAVAAVPEGLPAVTTIALGLGVRRMARQGALIRKLHAVETLGSTNVICTDKTGTLTVGQMTTRRLFVDGATFELSGEGYSPLGEMKQIGSATVPRQSIQLLADTLLGCSSATISNRDGGQWSAIGDPTEAALVVAAMKMGVDQQAFEAANPRVIDFPFDSDRKRKTVIRRNQKGLRAYTNGAPETLLACCTAYVRDGSPVAMAQEAKRYLQEINLELASLGFRVISSAYRDFAAHCPPQDIQDAEQKLTFVGFNALYDPPRSDVHEAVKQCMNAGIRVIMITGDQPRTALSIANTLNIASKTSEVLTGLELDEMNDDALFEKVASVAIYARVTAAHKLRIVRAWQAHGAIVAMTGDGVNDAPALHGADIGVAMGRGGTEVAKQASVMVITDDNFSTIVAAVEQGRGVFANIRKSTQYLLAGNFGELLFMGACISGGVPIPLKPIHLLWINLVTDGLPALCLAADPLSPDVMSKKLDARHELVDKNFLIGVLLAGGTTALITLLVYLWALGADPATSQTYAFSMLVFCELTRSLGARSEHEPLWSLGLFSNIRLLLVVAATCIIQIWSHHSQALATVFQTEVLNLYECLILLVLGLIPLAVLEVVKVLRRRSIHHDD